MADEYYSLVECFELLLKATPAELGSVAPPLAWFGDRPAWAITPEWASLPAASTAGQPVTAHP